MNLSTPLNNSISLLKKIISIPSYSFEEREVADYIESYLIERIKSINGDIIISREKNNIILYSGKYSANKKTLALCSHIDTVKASSDYTIDPFEAIEQDGKIYGLGSNDDGGCVVSQIEVFFEMFNKTENINLMLILTAEEEKSGPNGMDLVIECLKNKNKYPDYAILGEPTQMKAALGERGLLVIDAQATGESGHAARNEGINALYKAIGDILILKGYKFEKKSNLMGEVKLTVTQLNCGVAHNVIPDKATFVIDIRPTDVYSNIEIYELLQNMVESKLTPRNLTNKTSATPEICLLKKSIDNLNLATYISPTTSDWMRIDIPGIKMGPGDSSRSHRANEYIEISELNEGILGYIEFITDFNKILG